MSRKKQYSALQKRFLLEFIEKKPEIAKNQISNQYTSGDMRAKYIEISNTLNTAPGVQKCWKDWRSRGVILSHVQKKLSQNNRLMEQTGGGPDITVEVNPIGDRILNVIGEKQLIDGNIEVPETGLVVNFDHDYDMRIDHVEFATGENNMENKCVTPSSRKVKISSESPKNKLKSFS